MVREPQAVCSNGCTGLRRYRTIGNHSIVRCRECGLQALTTAEGDAEHLALFDDRYFSGAGDVGYVDYLSERTARQRLGSAYGKMFSRFLPEGGSVLDIGCAAGFILSGLRRHGFTGTGVELNAAMAEYARSRFSFPVYEVPIESFESDCRFDAVCFIQVLEHLRDPDHAVEKAAALLNPGGVLLIETWNADSLAARLLGRHWHQYDPPRVRYWFTPKSLDLLARRFGLEPIAHGRPVKWLSARQGQALLSGMFSPAGKHSKDSESSPNAMESSAERTGIMLPYPPIDVFWTLYA